MAKTSTSVKVGIWSIAIVLVAILAFMAISNTQVGQDLGLTDEDDAAASSCTVEPYIDLTVLNRLNQGSEVTVTVDGTINGVRKGSLTIATQKFVVGDEVKLLISADNYVDKVVETTIVKCGQNDISATMDATTAAGVSFDLWEKSTDLTDAATGANGNNASAIAAGGSEVYTLFVKGSDNSATADLVYVVEIGSTQNVSSLTMTQAGSVLAEAEIPNFYVDTKTSPYKKAFTLPSFDNAIEQEYSITVAATTGKTISGAVYTTAYAKQAFVDNDGSYAVGVTDSDNTATKYVWTDDVDMFIESA